MISHRFSNQQTFRDSFSPSQIYSSFSISEGNLLFLFVFSALVYVLKRENEQTIIEYYQMINLGRTSVVIAQEMEDFENLKADKKW